MMRCRQEEWAPGAKQRFVFLSSDSSLQAGSDYQMTLEDSIAVEHAHMASCRSVWLIGSVVFVVAVGV